MSDTPKTDNFIVSAGYVRPDHQWRTFARNLERERNSLQDQRDFAMGEIERLRKEREEAREALQSVMDWNPKPEYWERPETVARFEADMEKAREVLEETEETKPHQKWWEVLEEAE